MARRNGSGKDEKLEKDKHQELKESLIEALEIMSDPEMVEAFRKGIKDIKAGRIHSLEEVKK